MTALNLFHFGDRKVRVVIDESGEPLFVGKDVCEALGYADPTNAMKQHCRGVVKYHPIVDSLGRTQSVRVIHEGDTFRMIVSSTLPAAADFERLLFEVILPSIRRTGAYVHPAASDSGQAQLALAREIGALRDQVATQNGMILHLYQQLDGARRGHIRALSAVMGLEKRNAAREAKELVILLESQGVPRAEIVARSGKTFNHVRQIVHKARLAGRLPRQFEFDLTPAA